MTERLTDSPTYYKRKKREWYLNNKERANKQAREWALAHPERVREKRLLWDKSNQDRIKIHDRKQALKKYQLTPADYDKKLASQDQKCAICLRDATSFKRRLAVDHDHKTGKVRELLCTKCNIVLGRVEAVLEMRLHIKPFIAYIRKHQNP